MTINVFIDSNVWNLLFNFRDKFDLCAELPPEEFRIFVTREVELEIARIPARKADLKAFVEATIARCGVGTKLFFGFPDPRHFQQRVGGFDGKAKWQTKEERKFIEDHKHHVTSRVMGSELFENEADLSQGARSHHSVVVTWEGRNKKGPFKDASGKGGKVLFLRRNFDPSTTSLKARIKAVSRTTPKW
jgi:hypothetical protein